MVEVVSECHERIKPPICQNLHVARILQGYTERLHQIVATLILQTLPLSILRALLACIFHFLDFISLFRNHTLKIREAGTIFQRKCAIKEKEKLRNISRISAASRWRGI